MFSEVNTFPNRWLDGNNVCCSETQHMLHTYHTLGLHWVITIGCNLMYDTQHATTVTVKECVCVCVCVCVFLCCVCVHLSVCEHDSLRNPQGTTSRDTLHPANIVYQPATSPAHTHLAGWAPRGSGTLQGHPWAHGHSEHSEPSVNCEL